MINQFQQKNLAEQLATGMTVRNAALEQASLPNFESIFAKLMPKSNE